MSILKTEQIKHNNTGRMTTNLIDLIQVAPKCSTRKEKKFILVKTQNLRIIYRRN